MKRGVVAAGIATIIGSSFQFGYGSGILNNLEGALKDLYDKSGTSANISPWSTAWSLTTGFWCVGGFIGSIGGGPASNYLGRKWTIILTNIFTLTGVFLEVYPMGFYPFGANVTKGLYDFILSGRLINGIGCGLSTTLGPMFLTEISPIQYRGIFGTSNQFGVVLSILIAWIISLPELYITAEGAFNQYTLILGLPFVFGAIQLIILPFCPDSPLYLLNNAKTEDEKLAAHAAFEFYGVDKPTESESAKEKHESLIFSDELFYKPMIVAGVMMLSQQLCGINAIIFYSTSIFYQAGIDNGPMATLLVGITNVVFTFVSLFLIDRFGRRNLHLFSLSGIGLVTIILGVLLGALSTNAEASVFASIFILVFIAFFGCGAGPIPWFLAAELFDETNRPRAMAIAAGINWVANAIVAFSFPVLNEAIGGYTFFIFTVFVVIFIIYTFLFVPETKGKTVHEVQAYFMVSKVGPTDQEAIIVNKTVETDPPIVNAVIKEDKIEQSSKSSSRKLSKIESKKSSNKSSKRSTKIESGKSSNASSKRPSKNESKRSSKNEETAEL